MHPLEDRQAEVAAKLRLVRTLMDERGLAAAALSARRNVAWLTAGADTHVVRASEGGVVTLLVTAEAAVALTAVNEAPRIRDEELAGLEIELVAVPWEDTAARDRAIRARVSGRIGDDAALEDGLRPLRSRLSPPEQDRLASLGTVVARAMTEVLVEARPGELESVVAERLATRLAAEGASAPVLLAASDERIARYRHPIPKPRPIGAGLMFVVVAERGGLHAALTRMTWLRGRPDAELLRRYRATARIDAVLRAATVPGRTLAEVLRHGIEAYAAEGFADEWRLHHQGGPIAYQPREQVATPTSDDLVATGMAFAWNPSITGAKVEETSILRPDGRHEVVTGDPAWPAETDGSPAILVHDE